MGTPEGSRSAAGGLTDEDVLRVLQIVENSHFDYMDLQIGEFRLTIGRQEAVERGLPAAATPAGAALGQAGNWAADPGPGPAPADTARAQAQVPAAAAETDKDTAKALEGLTMVAAPTAGIFYRAPEPGAPPFVAVGQAIEETTTVGLLEVMKMFTAVKAKVAGTVVEICVADGQLVQAGDALVAVRPL